MPKIQNYTNNTPQYITPFEVVVHNQPDDCWISILGRVYDITSLIKQLHKKDCIKPLLAFAGKDISHWFDERTGDIQHYIHPITGVRVPYCPHGVIPHVNPQAPSKKWGLLEEPWWLDDDKYLVGYLTKRVRPVRIISPLTVKEVTINVCCEDTINRIMERYSIYNSDASSYFWRHNNKSLRMDKSLEENGVIDERDTYTDLGLPESLCIPTLFVYYNDDLKREGWKEWEYI